MQAATAPVTVIDRLWPNEGNRALRAVVLVALGSLLLVASAKVSVPMIPVPMTMQTFVVLLIGMTYGLRLGVATVAAYLIEGAVGLPVFTNTPPQVASLAYFAGPTGGYLAGFVAAVAAMGWLVERGWNRGTVRRLAALTIGTVIPLAAGVLWLGTLIGFERALAVGLMPFLAGAVVKQALAYAVVAAAEGALARRG